MSDLFHVLFVSGTFKIARKAVDGGAEGKPIDSVAETDYEQPRKRNSVRRFGVDLTDEEERESSDSEQPSKKSRSEQQKSESRKVKKIKMPDRNEELIREQLAQLQKKNTFTKKVNSANAISGGNVKHVMRSSRTIDNSESNT